MFFVVLYCQIVFSKSKLHSGFIKYFIEHWLTFLFQECNIFYSKSKKEFKISLKKQNIFIRVPTTNLVKKYVLLQAGNFGKPTIGPKEAEKNERHFTEEKLRAGQSIIGLQMGSNKGANQSGINFGNTRHM